MGKQYTPRMTITVRGDLRARMDKVLEPVNWSAVACRAFEVKLGEIATNKERKEMSDVVQRLRGSLRECEAQDYKDGFVAGKDWTWKVATAAQLRRLETARNAYGTDWPEMFQNNHSYSAPRWLVGTIEGQPDVSYLDTRDFWEAVLGKTDFHKSDMEDFLRGFAEGALGVWDEVQAKL